MLEQPIGPHINYKLWYIQMFSGTAKNSVRRDQLSIPGEGSSRVVVQPPRRDTFTAGSLLISFWVPPLAVD